MPQSGARDYYEVLGVRRTADEAEIKRAFRRLAHELHPDKNPGDNTAEERFKELARAYEVLMDGELRGRYDRHGHAAFDGPQPQRREPPPSSVSEVVSEIFSDIFGRRQGTVARERGRDKLVELRIDFATAVFGGERSIDIGRPHRCTDCRGTGARPGTAPALCHACGGAGNISVQQGVSVVSKRCGYCSGRGKIIGDPCGRCRGSGLMEVRAQLRVRVPAGTDDGTILRYPSEGEPGPVGGPPGDLRVSVRVVPDPIFKRDGNDILCELPVTISEAALGAQVEVPTLDGRVRMRLPTGSQTGRVLRLRAKGLPLPNGERGDQLVRIVVETPQQLGDKERALLEELGKTQHSAAYPLRAEFWSKVKDR